MARLRLCDVCQRNDDGSAAWHDLAAWPHETNWRPRPDAPALHDDQSFRRAYGPGMAQGLGPDAAGIETRAQHRDYLLSHGLAEGAPDTPGPGPRAQLAQKARAMFERAFVNAKRKVW